MLTIYTSKEYFPQDKKYIADVESLRPLVRLADNIFTKQVLSKIEKAERQDDTTFIDRFGRGLYVSCLSTGTKTLLLLNNSDLELILNGVEMGSNCWELLQDLEEGFVYIPNKDIQLRRVKEDSVVRVNDTVYTGEDINEALEEARYD